MRHPGHRDWTSVGTRPARPSKLADAGGQGDREGGKDGDESFDFHGLGNGIVVVTGALRQPVVGLMTQRGTR